MVYYRQQMSGIFGGSPLKSANVPGATKTPAPGGLFGRVQSIVNVAKAVQANPPSPRYDASRDVAYVPPVPTASPPPRTGSTLGGAISNVLKSVGNVASTLRATTAGTIEATKQKVAQELATQGYAPGTYAAPGYTAGGSGQPYSGGEYPPGYDPATGAASGMPGWVIPAAIGGGALVLFLLFRGRGGGSRVEPKS